MPDYTVVVPTYNEAESLPILVKKLRSLNSNVSIVVVDDSLSLETYNIAKQMDCITMHRKNSSGLSSAILAGFKLASTDKVIVMDADLQHPPEVIPKLAEKLNEHEMVIGTRRRKGGGVEGWSLPRKFISWFDNLLAFPIAPSMSDRTTGLFGIRKSLLSKNGASLDTRSWKIALEIVAKCRPESIGEVGYIFKSREKGISKFNAKQSKEIMKQKFRLYPQSQMLRFAAVGNAGMGVAIGVTWAIVELAGLPYQAGIAFSFVASTANNYVLNTVWTFKGKKGYPIGYGKYCLVSLLALGLYEGLTTLFVEIAGLWYLLGFILSILIVFPVNFILSKKFVWNKKKEEQQSILENSPKIA